jgi:hypothetical protein
VRNAGFLFFTAAHTVFSLVASRLASAKKL